MSSVQEVKPKTRSIVDRTKELVSKSKNADDKTEFINEAILLNMPLANYSAQRFVPKDHHLFPEIRDAAVFGLVKAANLYFKNYPRSTFYRYATACCNYQAQKVVCAEINRSTLQIFKGKPPRLVLSTANNDSAIRETLQGITVYDTEYPDNKRDTDPYLDNFQKSGIMAKLSDASHYEDVGRREIITAIYMYLAKRHRFSDDEAEYLVRYYLDIGYPKVRRNFRQRVKKRLSKIMKTDTYLQELFLEWADITAERS